MADFGMQMPGGRLKRSASMNVYTGLAFIAVVALITACGWMWTQAGKVGKDGSPFGLQEAKRVKVATPARR